MFNCLAEQSGVLIGYLFVVASAKIRFVFKLSAEKYDFFHFSLETHNFQSGGVERIEAVEGFFCVPDLEVIERAVLAFHEDFGFRLQFRCAFL